MLGGRSTSYEATSHNARAPDWSEACSAVVWKMLTSRCQQTERGAENIAAEVQKILQSKHTQARFVAECRGQLGAVDTRLLAAVLCYNGAKLGEAHCTRQETRVLRSFLKPLRDRAARRVAPSELKVEPVMGTIGTFHRWLSADPSADRSRDITRSRRIIRGLAQWPLGWMTTAGVLVYERAEGRIRDERNGRVDREFVKGLVKFDTLPTALANASDHYVVVSPNEDPRFMTVNEVARAFEIPTSSALSAVLLADAPASLTPNQAVSCLGRGIHVGVACCILETLKARGLLSGVVRYASMFSGIDTVAVAMEHVLGASWEYIFASEKNEKTRGALLAAWGSRGLEAGRCYRDALGRDVAGEDGVDLCVYSPTCEPHSPRNHSRSCDDERVSLQNMWASLEYVRRRHPRVVIVENVTAVGVVGPLTGMLMRLEGYTVEVGKLDPQTVAASPMSRERTFWVLTR